MSQESKPLRTNTYVYTRVSSKRQSKFNEEDTTFVSDDVQQSNCNDYLKKKYNLKIDNNHIINENASSFGSEMKAQNKLWDLLSMKNVHIIFYRIDRFSRSMIKGLTILNDIIPAMNITLHFVEEEIVFHSQSSPSIYKMVSMLLIEAENEGKRISKRQKDRIQRLRNLGSDIGQAGFGYENVKVENITKKLEKPSEQKIIIFIKKVYDIKEFNNNKSISFRVLYRMLKDLTDNKDIHKLIDEDPIEIWDSKVKSNMKLLSKGFDAECIAFILNSYKILKRGKSWTESNIKYIISNERSKLKGTKRKIDDDIVEIDSNKFVEKYQYQSFSSKKTKYNITSQKSKIEKKHEDDMTGKFQLSQLH